MKTNQTIRAFLILFTAGQWAFTCLPVAAVELNEAVDNTTLVWTTGGSTPWFGQTTQTHDGVDAAQSGVLTHNQTNWLETVVTATEPIAVSFWWKVSSENNYDWLCFYLGDALQGRISGEVGWTNASFLVPIGTQTLRWVYGKDTLTSRGSDCGWVDEVTLAPPLPPAITEQPKSQTMAAGTAAIFSVTASGHSLTYQWRKDDAALPGATNATLLLSNAHITDAGNYSVVVSNLVGTVISSNAAMTVTAGLTLEVALDVAQVVLRTGGNNYWAGQTDLTHDGVDAARSGVISYNQTNWMETIVAATEPVAVSFWWKVSSWTNYNWLGFYIGDALQRRISGEVGWTNVSFVVPPGTQRLRWAYWKSVSTVGGSDCGWVDEVAFAPPSPPAITEQPKSQTVAAGGAAMFGVTASGPSLSYQWRKDGAVLPGATNAILPWGNVHLADAGAYSVVVSNPVSTVISSNAVLTVTAGLTLEEALDVTQLVFTTDGNNYWAGQTNLTQDGVDAAQNDVIGNSQTTWLETIVNGPGTVGYWWRVSSQTNYDRLTFFVGGSESSHISGETGWEFRAFAVPAGRQTLRWEYRKDSSGTNGYDCGWVDQVRFAPPSAPQFVVQPLDQTVAAGSVASLSAGVFGALPVRYQWRKDGSDISDATNATLGLVNVHTNEAGAYSVVASNYLGTATSANAILSVLPGVTLEDALDTPELVWTSGGQSYWINQTNVTYDGLDAAQSGFLYASQTNWIQTVVTGPGTIGFWWKVSSEEEDDLLRFLIDDTAVATISGERDWAFRTFDVAAGTHNLRWTYSKNWGLEAGADAGWVDGVIFLPPAAPRIMAQPQNQNVAAGSIVSFRVDAIGGFPLRYQWRQGGVDLPGATNAALRLPDVRPDQAGVYSVVVSNDLGRVTSSNAVLRVVGPGLTLAEALDGPGLVWTTGGDTFWLAQTTETHDGLDAARSQPMTHKQTNWVETTVTGPGTLSFWWKVSSESWDCLRFRTNGTLRLLIAGEMDWRQDVVQLSEGPQRLRWSYEKDPIITSGADAGWLDQVVFAPPGPPVIAVQPTSRTNLPGSTATFSVGAGSVTPMAYQWRKEGTALPGATNATLALANVTTNDCGQYSVVVSNADGSVTSSNAALFVFGLIDPAIATLSPVATFGGEPGELIVRSNFVYMGQGSALVVMDVSNPQQPLTVGSLVLSGGVLGLAQQGKIAVATLSNGDVVVLDLTDARQPVQIGRTYLHLFYPGKVALAGQYAYVAAGGLNVIDLTDPASPQLLPAVAAVANANDVCALGNRLYVATSSKLLVLDASDAAKPVVLGGTDGGGNSVAAQGNYAFVGGLGLRVYNVVDPTAPAVVAFYNGDGPVLKVAINGSFAYLGAQGPSGNSPVLRLMDISHPQSPQPLGAAAMEVTPDALATAPPLVFVPQTSGLLVATVTNPASPAVLCSATSPGDVRQTFVAEPYLYVATPTGPWIYSLTDPANPGLIRAYADAPNLARIFVANNRLYEMFGAGSGSLTVIIRDASAPNTLAQLGTFTPDSRAVDLLARNDRLYLVTRSGSYSWLEIADVSNPANTAKLGKWLLPGQGLVLSGTGDLAFVGWTAVNRGGVSIIDVSSPAAPRERGRLQTAGLPTALLANQNRLFVGSGQDDGTGDLEVFDISNPDAPRGVVQVDSGGTIWGIETRNDLLFTAVAGHSEIVYNYSYALDLINSVLICPSYSSIDQSLTKTDASGATYIISAQGYADLRGEYRYGGQGITIQKYQITGGQVATLTTVVAPIEAGQQGCQTDPKRVDNIPIGTQIQVTAFAATGWNFEKWTGAATGTNRIAQAIVASPSSEAVAHFVKPVLTVTGGSPTPFFHPPDPEIMTQLRVMNVDLAANPVDDWYVSKIKFQASGTNGNEKTDIIRVRLLENGTVLDEGTYTEDNGDITLKVNREIARGGRLSLQLLYTMSTNLHDLPKDYHVHTDAEWVSAFAIHYPQYLILCIPNPLPGGAGIAPVWNVRTLIGYPQIQPAIDDPETKDEDTIMVAAGTYVENIRVDKVLDIQSVGGRIVTIIQAKDPNEHAVQLLKNRAEIIGFTIQGASGKGPNDLFRAGVYGEGTISGVTSCLVRQNGFGVYYDRTDNSYIRDNQIMGNQADGICLVDATINYLHRNVVSDNGGDGIKMQGGNCHHNEVLYNLIGTDDTGELSHPNQGHGITICEDAHGNKVGLFEQLADNCVDAGGNVISGNAGDGIRISKGWGNLIQANYIGLNNRGTLRLGNNQANKGYGGITIQDGTWNEIGRDQQSDRNFISGNRGAGVTICGSSSISNYVYNNILGLDKQGLLVLKNDGAGVQVFGGATKNTIGGYYNRAMSMLFAYPNYISGNGTCGISLRGDGNQVLGNYIGLDRYGKPAPNEWFGIDVSGSGNLIGGLETEHKNVISGNRGGGIALRGEANQVAGNWIGLNWEGKEALPNQGPGIVIFGGLNNVIGGEDKTARNIISGNDEDGVRVYAGTKNVVCGNYVGPDKDGLASVGNNLRGKGYGGITIEQGSDNTIGGATPSQGNLICYNARAGVCLVGNNATQNKIQANIIGADATAKTAQKNQGHGIWLTQGAKDNTIGGTVNAANTIFFNAGDGVNLDNTAGNGNAILNNLIGSNEKLGINLEKYPGDQVTWNEDGDDGRSPNGLQHYPMLTRAQSKMGFGTTILGNINSLPGSLLTLQFFANALTDPSGYGEGEQYLGSKSVRLDNNGRATFIVTDQTTVPVGNSITATATDTQGNTSEFSLAVPVQPATDKDFDGVLDMLEDNAPNLGDGNQDGIKDAEQEYVTSVPNEQGSFIILSLPQTAMFTNVRRTTNPSPTNAPAHIQFPLGFLDYQIHRVSPGGSVEVNLQLPEGTRVDRYYRYGPTLDQPIPHWFEFPFDGKTGASIQGSQVQIRYVDGERGDDDLTRNGEIPSGPGGPALVSSEVPVLTLAGGKPAELFAPTDPRLSNEVEVLTFSLTADLVAGWTVYSVTFKASGEEGDEVNDISAVRLFQGGVLLSQGTFSANDGTLRLNVNRKIGPGSSLHLRLVYVFNTTRLSQLPFPKLYKVQTSVGQINAEPTDPPYEDGLKLPPAPVIGAAVVAPVANIDTWKGYSQIQPAVDDPETKDGHTIIVCPGTYTENVKVTKSLAIRSLYGRDLTVVQADNFEDHVFHLMKDNSTVEGFTIKAATGDHRAGVFVSGSMVKNCNVISNLFKINDRGVFLNAASNCLVANNWITENLAEGLYLAESGGNVISNNVVSGNQSNGIRIEGAQSSGNLLFHNKIGIAPDGTTPWGNARSGILITNAPANLIGGENSRNIVGANTNAGLEISGSLSRSNIVSDNDISANYGDGILIYNASANYVGSTNSGNRANLFCNNFRNGVHLLEMGSSNNIISGNRIVGNDDNGVLLDNAPQNILFADREIRCYQQLGWNGQNAIEIRGEKAARNQIISQDIGEVMGYGIANNRYNGILITNAPENIIGGTNFAAYNHIVYSGKDGIRISGSRARANRIIRNYIGSELDPSMPSSLPLEAPNTENGISIENAPENTVEWNTISYNRVNGILIRGQQATRNTVRCNRNNFNQQNGIYIDNAPTNFIGGLRSETTTGQNNVISFNYLHGVWIDGLMAVGNSVVGNYISGNLTDGILITQASDTQIGGLVEITIDDRRLQDVYNTINGNNRHGIHLVGDNATRNRMEGNSIFKNEQDGICIEAGPENPMLGNKVFANKRLGINLVGRDSLNNPVTPNDEGDRDEGPNRLQNFPVLKLAVSETNGTRIVGTLNSIPKTVFQIEFFADEERDPRGYGQASWFLGTKAVTTDLRGNASFMAQCRNPFDSGSYYVTATATEFVFGPGGWYAANSSEFAQSVAAELALDSDHDGVADQVEALASNGGDANQDGIPDAQQQNVASIYNSKGQCVTIVSPPGTRLQQVDQADHSRPETNPADVSFPAGLFSYQLLLNPSGAQQVITTAGIQKNFTQSQTQSAAIGNPTRVELLLPEGLLPLAYYKYGPTPDQPTNHWYRFDFDGSTGAVIETNRLIIYYVDGGRGDDDLTLNGIIMEGVGGPGFAWVLRLGTPQLLPGGPAQLQLEGIAGYNYEIQASTNLIDWTGWATTNATDHITDFLDTNAPAFRQRFYRAVEWP